MMRCCCSSGRRLQQMTLADCTASEQTIVDSRTRAGFSQGTSTVILEHRERRALRLHKFLCYTTTHQPWLIFERWTCTLHLLIWLCHVIKERPWKALQVHWLILESLISSHNKALKFCGNREKNYSIFWHARQLLASLKRWDWYKLSFWNMIRLKI